MTLGQEVHIERSPMWDGLRMWVFERRHDGIYYPRLPELIKQEQDGDYIEPCLSLHNGSGQQLMDELWRAGLRPSEGTGSAGSLKATQDHLADMRKLVFEGRS